jgi:hypothetical protein
LARLEWRLPRGDISAYAWPQALVASIDFVKTGRQKDALLAHTLDLVIVDEAHGAARPPGGRGGRGQQLRHEFLCELATRLPRRPVQVAIWTEGQEPGRPLSFLDHHVRLRRRAHGRPRPRSRRARFPDAAYKPLTGDDKAVCRDLKRHNTREAKGQQTDTRPVQRH